MTFKDEMKAAGKSSNDQTGASGAESEDIAKLLRALNEDLKPDPADDDIAELDDEIEPKAERRLPLGKIAAALIAAAGVGFAVVMLDQESGAPSDPPAPAVVAPLITAAPAPGGSSSGASAPASVAKPEPLIARAPAPGAASPAPPPPAPPAPAPAVAPPPPPVVAAVPPSAPPALKVPELPPSAQTVTQTITPPKPATPEPIAKLPEPPPPSLAVKTPEKAAEPAKIAAVPEAPKAAPTPVKAPEPEKAAGAETTELQAMLSPKAAKRAKAEPKTQTASIDEGAVQSAAPASAPGGRYAVQLGSFHVAENAEALVRKLQSSGYRAYALDWTDAAQQSWRVVRVGGFGDTAAAKRVAGELKAKVGLDPMVVSTR